MAIMGCLALKSSKHFESESLFSIASAAPPSALLRCTPCSLLSGLGTAVGM